MFFLVQITNEIHSKRPLEPIERERIISSIQEDNQGHYTKYNQLAYALGDRTREFIYNQWLHIDPSWKRGRWSNDEQAQLLNHINRQTHSITNWPLVSAPVRTRSSRQCRERALDTLKTGNRPHREKHRLFTAEEDRLLLEQYALHGAKWSMIAKEFSSRTDNSLLVRYRMLIKAKNQWDWFCQIHSPLKTFLLFLYDKQPTTKISSDVLTIDQQDIRQDLEQFGFYRRGLPLPITDEEFQWFNDKPEFIETIARIALNEFSEKRLCFRKFKMEIKPWFTSPSVSLVTDDDIRQMLCRTIPTRRKRKSTDLSTLSKRSRINSNADQEMNTETIDCKQEPHVLQLPSILSTTSRHILRPVANQFFTTQSTSKLSLTSSSTHFCPYLILIRQNS